MSDDDISNEPPGYPHALIDTPAEMIHEIALALELPHEVAKKYGYSLAEYKALESTGWFQRAVSQAREEQEANGLTLTTKMRIMAESMLVHTFHAAKASESVQNKLDVAKYLSKLADIEPKQNQPLQQTSGFNIVINIPDYGQADHKTITLEGSSHAEHASLDTPRPGYVRLPVFSEDLQNGLNDDGSNESY